MNIKIITLEDGTEVSYRPMTESDERLTEGELIRVGFPTKLLPTNTLYPIYVDTIGGHIFNNEGLKHRLMTLRCDLWGVVMHKQSASEEQELTLDDGTVVVYKPIVRKEDLKSFRKGEIIRLADDFTGNFHKHEICKVFSNIIMGFHETTHYLSDYWPHEWGEVLFKHTPALPVVVGKLLTPDEYQTAAMKTASLIYTDWVDTSAMALMIEAAEFADLVHKNVHHEKPRATKEELTDELGDVMWNLACAAYVHDIKLSDVMQSNLDKLAKRHGDKYNPNHYNNGGK